MSSGWFNPAEPPRTCLNHSTGEGTRPVVELDMSSAWFNPPPQVWFLALCYGSTQRLRITTSLRSSALVFHRVKGGE